MPLTAGECANIRLNINPSSLETFMQTHELLRKHGKDPLQAFRNMKLPALPEQSKDIRSRIEKSIFDPVHTALYHQR